MLKEKICQPCASHGITRLTYKIVDGVRYCGGCVADMPIWCDPCLKKDPPVWNRAVAFHNEKHYCKNCNPNKPAPTLADLAKEAFGTPKPIEPPQPPVEEKVAEEVVTPVEESPKEEGEPLVAKQIDWEQLRSEREAGASVKELSKKYGCSDVSIYQHLKKLPKSPSRKTAPASAKHGAIASAIVELERQKSEIETALGVLRKLAVVLLFVLCSTFSAHAQDAKPVPIRTEDKAAILEIQLRIERKNREYVQLVARKQQLEANFRQDQAALAKAVNDACDAAKVKCGTDYSVNTTDWTIVKNPPAEKPAPPAEAKKP